MLSFKQKFYLFIKNNNLKQKNIAKQLNITPQYLNQFLTGKRDSVKLQIELQKIMDNFND